MANFDDRDDTFRAVLGLAHVIERVVVQSLKFPHALRLILWSNCEKTQDGYPSPFLFLEIALVASSSLSLAVHSLIKVLSGTSCRLMMNGHNSRGC